MNLKGQTSVSGGIYSNTTWTLANSPYIVTDTVVVFPSVTLTIEPGVVVKFEDNKRLVVKLGKLIAVGNSKYPIIFTTNSGTLLPGNWDGIYLNTTTSSYMKFEYCHFYYANRGIGTTFRVGDPNYIDVINCTFIKNKTGILCSSGYIYHIFSSGFRSNETGVANENTGTAPGVKIWECVLDSNKQAGITFNAGKNSIVNCTIKNNGIGILDQTVRSRKYVSNVIENNIVGIKIGEYQNEADTIICNSICNNSSYGFYYNNMAGDTINIADNYWCTANSASISTAIYDGYDDFNLGLTTFKPYKTSSCNNTSSFKEAMNSKKGIAIYPNPATNFIKVNLNESSKNGVIKVYNMLGEIEIIYHFGEQGSILDVSQLKSGVYLLLFENSDFTGRQSFIKQ